MEKSDLTVSLVQTDLLWEQPAANRERLEVQLRMMKDKQHIIVLPETFTTGFSMQAAALAESMDGPTVNWMKALAAELRCIIAGSVIISDEGSYHNRLLWVLPNGTVACYNKRHLFSYAGEDAAFTPGQKRMIAQVNGWKICLQICYDLRFPVWSRNTDDYDLLLYVANWPEQRNYVWENLLQARSIENMCFTIGVNRVGSDGKGHNYIGNSRIYDPLGRQVADAGNNETIITYALKHTDLAAAREKFPFLKDRDSFILK